MPRRQSSSQLSKKKRKNTSLKVSEDKNRMGLIRIEGEVIVK